MKERTRIAPSPTGMVHIGTLRTALWDYFLAKQTGGSFLLRIEDTDQARSVEGGVENLLETFHLLGIEPDEGLKLMNNKVVQVGESGPYVQSERLERYKEYALMLVEQGDAYYSFRTPEEVSAIRENRQKNKTSPREDRAHFEDAPEEVEKRLAAGDDYVIRLRVPEGKSTFEDVVRGTVTFDHAEVDDQVLLKSDGFPTYHLAVVVDDHEMGITTVLRGEEWLSSTPKQLILYKMLGWEAPRFAHVPLLLNPDKSKLSKRQGDVSAKSYLDKGYLKEALINFLATLGYNPTGDREVYTEDELISLFNLSKVKKSGAVVNFEKLDWMNKQYLQSLPLEAVNERLDAFTSENPDNRLRIVEVERARQATLVDIAAQFETYAELPDYDTPIVVFRKSDARETADVLKKLLPFVQELSTDNLVQLEADVKEWINANELQMGTVLHPLRVSLSGQQTSPSPFEMLFVLGSDEAVRRINIAIKKLEGEA